MNATARTRPAFRQRTRRAAETAKAGFFERRALNSARRETFYIELAELISNGVSLQMALEEIARVAAQSATGDKRYVAVISEIRRACKSQALAQAIAPYATTVERLVLQAGERDPVAALRQCAKTLRLSREAASGAFAGLAYPVGMLNTAIGYIYGFATVILPTFGTMIKIENLTGMGAFFSLASLLVRDWIVPGYAFVFLVIGLFWVTLPTWTGSLRARFDLFFPWSAYRATQGAAFLMSLSAMISAGHPLPAALETMAEGATPWLRERILAARLNIKGGDANIGTALRDAGYNFPDPGLNQRLVLVSQFRNVDKQLETLASEWIERTKAEFAARSNRYGIICMMIVMLTMAFIGLGMMDIVQQFSTAAGLPT